MVISKRRKRRKTYKFPIFLMLLALFILGIFYVIGSVSGRAKQTEPVKDGSLILYSQVVTDFIKQSNDVSAEFSRLRQNAKKMARSDLEKKLNELAVTSDNIAAKCASTEPPQSVRKAHSYLQIAFDLRAEAIKDFKLALFNALGDMDVEVSARQMLAALAKFQLSDEAYTYFSDELARVAQESGEKDLKVPTSSFLQAGEAYDTTGVINYVSSLKTVETLQPIHGVAIVEGTAALSPAPVGTTEGYLVIPFANTFSVTVSVENQGNQVETNVPLVVILKSELDPNPKQKMVTIPVLNPGEIKQLTVSNVESFPGSRCLLTVKVGPVVGEKYEGNNVKEIKVFFESPQG